jgi:PAS domain S-box-containing protein
MAFPRGESGQAANMRAHDWSASPLGDPSIWPEALRSVVELLLGSKFPMFVAWGEELGLLYNDAYVEILGGKHPAALGAPFKQVWAEIWLDIEPSVKAALAGEATFHENLPLVMNRSGSDELTYFTFSYSPVRDEKGDIAGMFCTCAETTNQVLATKQAEVVQERQRQMLLQMPGFIGMMSGPELIYTYVNQAYVEISARTNFLGRRFRDVFADISGQGYFELFEQVFHSGQGVVTRGMELRLHGRDESQFVDFVLEPIRDDQDCVTGVFVGGYETTEIYRGNHALRKSEARLELATKAAALGIWDWEIATGQMTYSPLAKAICGFPADLNVTYEDAKRVTHPDDYTRTSVMAHRALDPAIREVQPYEYRILRPDGSIRWVIANGEAVFDEVDGVVQATRYVGTIRDVTERKQAEQALHEQAAISAQLAEGVIVANCKGKLTFVNDAAARLHGVAELGVEPERYSDTYHLFTEDNRPYPPMDLPLSRALRGETIEDARWRIKRPDGTSVLAIGSARPVRDGSGAQVGAVLTVRDDTAREAAERELRENEARLRALTDNLPGGMVYQISTGKDGSARKFLFVSASHERLTGIPAEDVLQDPTIPYKLIHPDDQPRLVLAEVEAIRERKPFDVQVRFRRTDGAERWCRILSACREQPDGSLLWEGLQIDVTEQVEAEKAIRDLNATLEERVAQRTSERNLLATLIEATDVMVMACDLQYNILAVNRANAAEFERVYGTRPKAGDHLLDLLADQPEHQEEVRAGWTRPLSGQEITVIEEFGDPGRDRPYYAITFRNLLNGQGERIGAYQFVTDVTERLKAEAELIETQEALRQSQKMEAMGQLTGGVAHDFNNLLTPIVGSLDMLMRRGLGSEREQRLISGAMQSAERAKTLVQRLLAFARRQPLQPTAVDVRILVSGLAGLLESTLGPKIDVHLRIADNLPPARADANQLEMAVLNLAVNARDAMPDGGVLTISATHERVFSSQKEKLKKGEYLRLSVSDTGVGMDEGTVARAIEPFFSTKGIGKGTGLGLSMVHGLAAQLGGKLSLQSTPGSGTSVELWLPVSSGTAAQPLSGTSGGPSTLGQMRVLLVDDEELVRLSTAAMLVDLGYEVLEASSGEEALVLLQETTPDLLLTDHLMPGMSGVELANAARERIPSLPTLIISGYAELEGLAPELARLTKPFRNSELAECLSSLARERG